jgi:hypothetical protein
MRAPAYEPLASLLLAKLYQSTGRPAGAHDVLAPALEGFSPTPEMPEITEAEELLAAVAQWSARNGLCATMGRSHLARPTQSGATQIKRRRDLKVPLCPATCGTRASTKDRFGRR